MAGVALALAVGARSLRTPRVDQPLLQGPPGPRDLDPSRLEPHLEALGYAVWDATAHPELTGVVRHDRARAQPGYNLFTDNESRAFAMSMEGRIVHTWRFPPPYRGCEEFELLEDGSVIAVCVDHGVLSVDRDSRLLWRSPMPAHHDIALLQDGSILAPRKRFQQYHGRPVDFDEIVQLSPGGIELTRWWSFDHLNELRRCHPPLALDTPGRLDPLLPQKLDYYHLNSIEILPDTPLGRSDGRFAMGNLLICLRNANLVLVLDRSSWSIVWHWGVGDLDLPHLPTMLDSGNILIFDNGVARGHSRVLELRPDTGEVVWVYGEAPEERFFSKWGGSARRLAGGTTLICDSDSGHVLEVSPDGQIVWEFWNPEVRQGQRRRIYRFSRISRDLATAFLEGEDTRR